MCLRFVFLLTTHVAAWLGGLQAWRDTAGGGVDGSGDTKLKQTSSRGA